MDVAAHAARMGFDFLWIEMEHSPITLETLHNIVLATRGLPALPFARVSSKPFSVTIEANSNSLSLQQLPSPPRLQPFSHLLFR